MTETKQHISPEMLTQFHKNELSKEDYFMVLEHISNCTYCADLFAQSFDENQLIQAPHYLKDSIMEKAEKQVKLPLPSISRISRRKQLLFYSLKVCAATLGALMLLFFSPNINISETKALTMSISDMKVWNTLNQSVEGFSEGISKQLDTLTSFSFLKELK
jgi:hypothetical protein